MTNCSKSTDSDDKRVLIVAPQPYFEERGTPIAISYVLKALSELNYTVDLLAFPVGQDLSYPNVTIHRVINLLGIRSVPIGFSMRKVFLDIALFFKIRSLIKRNEYCYIHAVEEAAYLSVVARGRTGIPIVYDMASSLPEQLQDLPILGSRVVNRIMSSLEASLVNRVNYVTCSAGLLPHVRSISKYVPASEWWFPSVVNDVVDSEQRKSFRQDISVAEDDTLFVYTGSFASYQGIQLLLDAISILSTDGFEGKFLLIGATKSELANLAESSSSDLTQNLILWGRMSRPEVAQALAAADVLISPRLFGNNVPLKIFDYMGAGKPIIASNIPAHTSVLDSSRAVLYKNTSQDLAKAIVELCRSPSRMHMLGRNAQEYANEKLSWPRFRELIRQISDVVRQSPDVHATLNAPAKSD
jgi:glycosyltransferase involved in cell wall biosynthesis